MRTDILEEGTVLMSFKIRAFDDRDIDFALAQTGREGWDNTRSTLRVCLSHEPEGCFIAEMGGRRAGMVTTTRYTRSAWIGNLIVAPPYRRQGIRSVAPCRALPMAQSGTKSVRPYREVRNVERQEGHSPTVRRRGC
ncbi:MAG: GNAT family N-acetyltransferase [Phycisphaerae bacterium]|nr:GNAT family N-acetyltransferase [Phycisphaerae bacterium]